MSKFIKLTLRSDGSTIIRVDDIEEVVQYEDYSRISFYGCGREDAAVEETTSEIYRMLETKQ